MKTAALALGFSLSALSACAAPPPDLQLTTAQWRADLQVLAQELPRRHLNAFHAVSKAQFEAAVAALDQQIPRLDGDQVFVGMEQLVRLIGDGHTRLHDPPDAGELPLRIQRFGDAWRVTATAPGAEAALGARVTAIGGVPIAQAHALMLAVTPS